VYNSWRLILRLASAAFLLFGSSDEGIEFCRSSIGEDSAVKTVSRLFSERLRRFDRISRMRYLIPASSSDVSSRDFWRR